MGDVIVVGAGLAGLVAANRAAQLGLRVVVLEQGAGDEYLCNSRIATGALNFAHSSPRLPVEQLVRAVMDDTEGHADPDLARAMAGVIGRGIEWLESEGASYQLRKMQDKETIVLAPPRRLEPGLDWRGRGADVLLHRLAANLKQRGGELLTGSRALSLLVSDGRCTGSPNFTGIALALSAATDADAERIFNALAAGGKVNMPMAKTFFSSRFGMCNDKFGVGWMVLVAR